MFKDNFAEIIISACGAGNDSGSSIKVVDGVEASFCCEAMQWEEARASSDNVRARLRLQKHEAECPIEGDGGAMA